MSRKPGLFGAPPPVLLVDDRPRGIDLQSLRNMPLPALRDEPEPDSPAVVDDEDALDDDSYDGGGPLRIFIGSPKRAGTAPVVPSLPTPIWDASALASAADDEGLVVDTGASRARPILLKPPSQEPPPLTMSFGKSFSRGDLDAGVMDDGQGAEASAAQRDSVVVHQKIYDRLLRFDDPAERSGLVAFDSTEAEDEPLSVGASDEDESYSDGGGSLPPSILTDAPPARTLSLSFGAGQPPKVAPHADDTRKVDDTADEESGLPWEKAARSEADPVGSDADPDSLTTADIDDANDSLTHPLEPVNVPAPKVFGDSPRTPVRPADIDARVVTGEEKTLPRTSGPPTVPPTVFTRETARQAPDWSAQRKAAQSTEASSDESSGASVLTVGIFVVLILALIAGTWYLLRDKEPPVEAPEAPAPVEAPAEVLPVEPEAEPTPAAAPTGELPEVLGDDGAVPPADDPLASLDPAPSADEGLLLIRATRPSRVFVNGRYVGHTPLPAQVLPVGTHEVRVVAIESGKTREQTVRIDAGQSRDLRFSL